MTKDSLARMMVAARKRAGLTQTQIAERMGVAQGTVSAWEVGKNEPEFQHEGRSPVSGVADIAQGLDDECAMLLQRIAIALAEPPGGSTLVLHAMLLAALETQQRIANAPPTPRPPGRPRRTG